MKIRMENLTLSKDGMLQPDPSTSGQQELDKEEHKLLESSDDELESGQRSPIGKRLPIRKPLSL